MNAACEKKPGIARSAVALNSELSDYSPIVSVVCSDVHDIPRGQHAEQFLRRLAPLLKVNYSDADAFNVAAAEDFPYVIERSTVPRKFTDAATVGLPVASQDLRPDKGALASMGNSPASRALSNGVHSQNTPATLPSSRIGTWLKLWSTIV